MVDYNFKYLTSYIGTNVIELWQGESHQYIAICVAEVTIHITLIWTCILHVQSSFGEPSLDFPG